MRCVGHLVAAMVVAVLAVGRQVGAVDGAEQWPRAIGGNVVANGGFEEGGNARIAGWGGDPAVYSVDRGRGHGGAASLRYHNDDPKRYVLATQQVKLQPGALYEYGAWVRTEDVRGEDSGATLCLEWSDAKGKYLGGSYGPGVKGTRDWTYVHDLVRVPADAVGFTLTCYLRKGMTGTAWFDDVSLVRMAGRPMQVVMLEPNYRGWLTGDVVKVRALLDWRDWEVKAGETWRVTAQLQGAESGTAEGVVRPGEATHDLILRVPPTFATGEQGSGSLVVRLVDQGGKEIARQDEVLVRKAPGWTPRVGIDQRGRTTVEGKPFFPIGFYLGAVTEEDLRLLTQSRVNCIMPYGSPDRKGMDLAQKYGLKVIYSTKDWYYGTQWSPGWLKSEEQEQQAIRDRVREFRDHPALLAWYLNDELPVTFRPRLLAHQQWTAREDPEHPTWAVLYQVDDIAQYLGTCDVIGSDPYPIGSSNPRQTRPSLAGEWTRKTVSGMGYARPAWMVPQVHNLANYYGAGGGRRSPTAEEVRSMSWQCIAEGATGLVYYSWFDLRKNPDVRFEEHWAKLRGVIAEIDGMAPVILGEASEAVTVRSPKDAGWLHVLTRRHDNKDYAVLVSDGDGQGTVRLEIPQGSRARVVQGEAKMVQEGRSVEVGLPRLGVAVVEVR